ncbi:XkdQ/YqbQ family protein [Megasphaera sp. UBA4352]|uniref:XkdQ/YqbQ family protein n=1 Tax=Megasphaera sp. UBA4352 TaxID=1946849 RepID=UPI003784E637
MGDQELIIKHKQIVTETTKDASGRETTTQKDVLNDISRLTVGKITWEGSRLQVARKLTFSYVQDARDPNLPNYVINCGETVYGYDEDGNLQFQGNVYSVEKNVQQSTVTVMAYDNLFILCRSKTTRKFTDMLAEDIAKEVCSELGIKVGKLAETGKKVSFIAQEKTGYQIIMIAYTDAANQINTQKENKDDPDVLFHPVMRGDELNVIKKGELIEGMEANQYINIENSQYKESIESMVNSVMITDQQGNVTGYQTKDEWIQKYSMVQDVYKKNPNDNTQEAINKLFHGPDRTGIIDMLGNYAAKSSYSIQIKDILTELCGKFWIKSDTHTFENGIHEMRLEIEFENIMNKEEKPKEIKTKTGRTASAIGGANLAATEGVQAGFAAWEGATMPDGPEGCVEAATRIGSYYSPFLKQEYDDGVAGVDRLVGDAGDGVIDFDQGQLEVGDCVVYGDNDHVVIYSGDGCYVGNNSSANNGNGAVGTGGIYNIGQTPTKIIKTSHM